MLFNTGNLCISTVGQKAFHWKRNGGEKSYYYRSLQLFEHKHIFIIVLELMELISHISFSPQCPDIVTIKFYRHWCLGRQLVRQMNEK